MEKLSYTLLSDNNDNNRSLFEFIKLSSSFVIMIHRNVCPNYNVQHIYYTLKIVWFLIYNMTQKREKKTFFREIQMMKSISIFKFL